MPASVARFWGYRPHRASLACWPVPTANNPRCVPSSLQVEREQQDAAADAERRANLQAKSQQHVRSPATPSGPRTRTSIVALITQTLWPDIEAPIGSMRLQCMFCCSQPSSVAHSLACAQLAAYEKVRQEKLVHLQSLATSFQARSQQSWVAVGQGTGSLGHRA